jgi:hypothetical protein
MLPEKLAIGRKEEDAAVERSSFALYDPDREMDSVFSCHLAQEVRLAVGTAIAVSR